MRTTAIVLGIGLMILVGVPSAQADNPSVGAPTDEANGIVAGAVAFNTSVQAAAFTFADAVTDNADNVPTALANGQIPVDEAENVSVAALGAGTAVRNAALEFATGTVLGNATTVVTDKLAEAAGVAQAVNETVLAGIDNGATFANETLQEVCKAPVAPVDPEDCNADSVVSDVSDAAGDVTTAANNFLASINPVPIANALVQAIRDLLGV